LCTTIFLSGCSYFQKQPAAKIEVVVQQVPVEIYQPPSPAPVLLENVEWLVITEENLQEKLSELNLIFGKDGYVFYAITPRDYENLAYNLQEIRRFIRQQKEIVLYYRSVTQQTTDEDGDGDVDIDDWKIKNKRLVDQQLDVNKNPQ